MKPARLALAVTLVACAAEGTPPPSAPESPSAAPASPVLASFQDLGQVNLSTHGACDVHFVAVASGEADVGTRHLGPGDVAMIDGPASVEVHGHGVALVASLAQDSCDPRPAPGVRVYAATGAPELVFAKGAMHAHLDVEKESSPRIYFGRLAGTAPVAEHQHDSSWEILCAIDAAGTMTLAGAPSRVGPRQCVAVPPGTKHSWSPDPGATPLSAFQMYVPPGPEQRFKKLAADSAR